MVVGIEIGEGQRMNGERVPEERFSEDPRRNGVCVWIHARLRAAFMSLLLVALLATRET